EGGGGGGEMGRPEAGMEWAGDAVSGEGPIKPPPPIPPTAPRKEKTRRSRARRLRADRRCTRKQKARRAETQPDALQQTTIAEQNFPPSPAEKSLGAS